MAGNQYVTDPRQAKFLAAYLDPNSETFSNALRSALKAGYSQEYAENITHLMPDWLSEAIGDAELVSRAEKALSETLNYLTVDEEGKVDASVAKIKQDTAKFILSRLNKQKYSDRTEVTGKDGQQINFVISSDIANKHGIKSETKRDSE